MRYGYIILLCACISVMQGFSTFAQGQEPSLDLTEMSLEELMNINVEVTSVAKKEQPLFEAAAAISVITQADIRRSGVTNIPEALRLVPGLQVAHVDANKWAISSRGFNNLFANKLLVMIDGRSVYTPLFAGTYWDVQDLLPEDIDRIEVIRGPGALLWGANAVNGVINIITKRASATQGGLFTGGIGSEERIFGGIRYGGGMGARAFYRVYARSFKRDQGGTSGGQTAADEWDAHRGGFRLDWGASANDSVMAQIDIYDVDSGQTYTEATPAPPFSQTQSDITLVSGKNMLMRWYHTISSHSATILQAYYDQRKRFEPFGIDIRKTFDIDFQHQWTLHDRYELIWGLHYRLTTDDITGNDNLSFVPPSRDIHLISGFVQNEFQIVENRLRLTFGSKLEHNSFSDFEIQPSGRILWIPHERHAVWGAVSRAVRTPSRSEQALRFTTNIFPNPDGSLSYVTITGNRAQPEELIASEFGYRVRATDRFSLDTAFFYNVYNDLGTEEPGTPFFDPLAPIPHVVVPIDFLNRAEGETYGAEVNAVWNILPNWTLRAAYTGLDMRIRIRSVNPQATTNFKAGDNPQHQFHLRTSVDLPQDLEADAMFWYVDRLPDQGVPRYARTDLRIGWNGAERVAVSLVGQNLFDARHLEFGNGLTGVQATQVQRSVYGKFTWRF